MSVPLTQALGQGIKLHSPYSSPTANLGSDESGRSYRHAIFATLSAATVVPCFVVVLYVAAGQPLSDIARTYPELIRPLLLVSIPAILSGAVLLRFRNLKWYWAIVLGPIISITILYFGSKGYYYVLGLLSDPGL